MINIRNKVFETNSSSSHSIAICMDSDGILDTIPCTKKGIITIRGGEFGREWVAYNKPRDKASYCASDCKNSPEKIAMLKKVIKDHTGCKTVKIIFDTNSYVDHESVGNSDEAFVDEETLKNLIFNPESYIFTGSDESTPPPNYYDVSKKLVFTHQLEIDGTTLIFKFQGIPCKDDLDDAIDSIMDRHKMVKYSFTGGNQELKFDYIRYDKKDITGNIFNSMSRYNQGVIVLYKSQPVWANGDGKYIGDKIVDSKELHFQIVPIKKDKK